MSGRRTALVGLALVFVVGLLSVPHLLLGSDQSRVKELIQNTCAGCHRLEGKPDSRLDLCRPQI